jgi:hypothetical protein
VFNAKPSTYENANYHSHKMVKKEVYHQKCSGSSYRSAQDRHLGLIASQNEEDECHWDCNGWDADRDSALFISLTERDEVTDAEQSRRGGETDHEGRGSAVLARAACLGTYLIYKTPSRPNQRAVTLRGKGCA